jgi:hypothetical protein
MPTLPIEKQLKNLLPTPSHRFYRKMARAAWTQRARKRRSAFIIAGTLFMAVIAMLLATPQGRAWAQETILRFFTRAEDDKLPLATFQMTSIAESTLTPIPSTATPDPGYIFNQVVIEIEQQAGFDILEPTWVSEILFFDGASYDPEQNISRIIYRHIEDERNGLIIRQEPFQTSDDCELCGLVGLSAEVETVQIGTVTGEYVEGVWKLTESGPVWETDPWIKTLRWQANGMAFEISFMGPPTDVTQMDMIAIAESMK